MGSDNAMEAVSGGKSRKCTDLLCTLLFLVFWGGMLYISITGFLFGDPDRLLYALDYKFDQCAKDNSAAARGIASLEQDVPLVDGSGTQPVLLGGKNLAERPLFYVVAPGGTRWASNLVGICTSECPNADLNGIGYQPDQWICTGKYYDKSNRPDMGVKGVPELTEFTKEGVSKFVKDIRNFQDDATESLQAQLEYLSSFFLIKGASTCADTLAIDAQECTVCYPSYPTVRYGSAAYCLPDVTWIAENKDQVAAVLGDAFDLDFLETAAEQMFGAGGAATLRIVADAYTAFPVILACTAFAVILGFVWALLMRLFIKPMVFATLVGVFLGLVLGVVTLWLKADSMRSSALYNVDNDFTVYADVTMGFFAANLAALVVYVLFICCLWSKIFLACGVIVEASKALQAMPSLLLVPIVPALLTFCTLVYFVVGAFYIVSAGELKVNGSGVAQISYDDELKGALAYHFFGCIWTSVLLNHLGWAIVAMAVVQWYFAKARPDDLGSAPVATAAGRVLRYHFGTVVFGSLVVAIVRFIRYMMNAMKQYADPENRYYGKFIKCIWCCIDCCLRCFEKLLEFISRNAYIILAVESESFCTSARHAFGYLVSNMSGLAMVQTIGDLFLFLGKLFVALASAGICAVLLTSVPYFDLNTSSIVLPCMIVLIGAYLIASLFMGIFEMAIDTIFLSFCIDEDKQLGFADGALRDYVKANARAPAPGEARVVTSTASKRTVPEPTS